MTVIAASVAAAPVGAVPSTKYYTVTASPSALDVSATPTQVTFTLTNCSGTTCAKGSTQSWGSAHVTLPSAWNWGYTTPTAVSGLQVYSADGSPSSKTKDWGVSTVVTDPAGNTIVELGNDGTNSAFAVAPGEWLTFTASLTPTPAGLAAVTTEVKQSNDFSGTGNDFLHATGNTDPTIVIGPPDHLEFGTAGPQTVQQSTSTANYYMCDGSKTAPSVRVVDKSGNPITWVQGLAITLSSSGNPGLKYKATTTSTATTTLTESTVNGVATFGSACTTGLSASNLGAGYVMGASATLNGTALSIPTADQQSFDVLQYYQVCGASCPLVTIKGSHTSAGASGSGGSSSSTDRLGMSVGVYGDLGGCQPEASNNPDRQIVSVDLSNHTKQVTLSWDKQTVQIFTNNGTPFWNVCIWTLYPFTVAGGGPPTPVVGPPHNTTWYTGFLASCTNVDPISNPCISNLYRRSGVEFADISLPNVPGDPHLF